MGKDNNAAEGGRALILIRHSLPQITPEVPARQWELSAVGRRRCGPLARRISPFRPQRVFTSREPKAVETARRVAEALDLPWAAVPDLHEHDRRGAPFLQDHAAFERQVVRLFARPDRLVFGRETADQAHRRFADAVLGLLGGHPNKTLAVVSHGTVISLFVSRSVGLEPVPFWQSLGMPAYVVLRLPLEAGTVKGSQIVAQSSWDETWVIRRHKSRASLQPYL